MGLHFPYIKNRMFITGEPQITQGISSRFINRSKLMITADQIVAHLVGDYLLQSHWMATEKTKNSLAAAVHAIFYTLPFALISQNAYALAIICGTHFLIDRFRIARYIVWLKNGPWKPLTATGYPDDVPAWLSVWLLIIADNTIHILINGAAIGAF